MQKHKLNERHFQNALRAAFMLFAFFLSFYLMFHTFSYDAQKQEMRIASKLWSDFGAHIPLIRSFSQGPNLARLLTGQSVESPLFPGEPIRYHYGFYALVGVLEKIGIRIDWALNVPSALGFFFLMVGIYVLAQKLFHHPGVSFLSVIFFLFNGSLSVLTFLRNHPLSGNTFAEIVTNSRFPSFGPWDGGTISAFWNLNIYTNQRHLALSYALVIAVLLINMGKSTRRTFVATTLCISTLLFMNYAGAAIALLFLLGIFLTHAKNRLSILIAGMLTLPAFILLRQTANLTSLIEFQPGFLLHPPITFASFFRYWMDNIGFHLILIPIGIILAPKHVRRNFVAPLLLLFILPNLYRFSPDMINNHKFFNFFLIMGNMFSAYAILFMLQRYQRIHAAIVRIPLQILVGGTLVGLLTLSGIIDLFPVINDSKGTVSDVSSNPDAAYVENNTRLSDVIANSTWFYHPASLTGRPIYSGYTYFTWSYGYDQSRRESVQKSLYQAPSMDTLCRILRTNTIAFIELTPQPEAYLQPNWALWNALLPSYENPKTRLKIYKTEDICTGQ